MSIIGKAIMSSFLVLVTTAFLASEKNVQKEQSYIEYISGNLAGGLVSLGKNLDSLKNTVVNAMSDDAAFLKLGWPTDNQIAKQELQKCKEIYARYDASSKKCEISMEHKEDCAFIERRTSYCKRVLSALQNNTIPNCADRPKLALHCLTHHEKVLNQFDKETFFKIVGMEQRKAEEEAQQVNQQLQKITNNQDINKEAKK
jgi:hypothetical protein